jgi:alpha-N-arabinofuranosidase
MRRFVLAASALLTVAARPAEPKAYFDWFEYRGEDPTDRTPLAPGSYRNPILKGFYPDPSLTRVGDDFYLVTSTFAWFPGLPVFHSRDLVHWTQIGNAIDRPGQVDFARLGLSRGLFAPDISEHGGTFYILNTCVDCGGNFLLTATNPAGPWSDPIWLPEIEGGIDPSLFWDEDGSAWILNNGPPPGTPLYEGHRAIWIQRFDPQVRKMVGPRSVLVDGGVDRAKKPIWIEGPHIFRKDGFYYLIAAEGGTAEGHSQVVLRSRSATGPYAPFAGNPILTQRDLPAGRPQPITSAGHGDFVETRAGQWWATFLAVRPYSGDLYNTGRETFLLPVTWQGGWPRITRPGEAIGWTHAAPRLPRGPVPPVPTSGAFTVRDEYEGPGLPLYWMTMRNPRERWYALRGGALELRARPVGLADSANPTFLARRQQHLHASATTRLRLESGGAPLQAGLVALQNDDYWYFLAVRQAGGRSSVELQRRAGGETSVLASTPLRIRAGAAVYLRIAARGGAYDFDYATSEHAWRPLRTGEDGTMLSTRKAGGFVGAVLGVAAVLDRRAAAASGPGGGTRQ